MRTHVKALVICKIIKDKIALMVYRKTRSIQLVANIVFTFLKKYVSRN
jgi:hypothetical protein